MRTRDTHARTRGTARGPFPGSEIKEFASQHFPLISQILGMVPRQMLLIFKTNDLLRGIESSLDFFGLHQNKQKILEVAEKSTGCHQKNVTQSTYPKLEEALLVWLKSTVASNVPVSGILLKQKAEMMALQRTLKDLGSVMAG
ncbi:hypothetical protein HPB51_023694 [Rhipicephalus microplus]|uniref:HTH CENPB-type domain-containing protein n=1 Tax=Rhipicephalus microplus TaxID=6941 RepID=A0A9J6E4F1_RHIMP|nr:hypothetical protein HPB51_023694 [Rhipicephalus microplus]